MNLLETYKKADRTFQAEVFPKVSIGLGGYMLAHSMYQRGETMYLEGKNPNSMISAVVEVTQGTPIDTMLSHEVGPLEQYTLGLALLALGAINSPRVLAAQRKILGLMRKE